MIIYKLCRYLDLSIAVVRKYQVEEVMMCGKSKAAISGVICDVFALILL